jgi:hypothetical protein
MAFFSLLATVYAFDIASSQQTNDHGIMKTGDDMAY